MDENILQSHYMLQEKQNMPILKYDINTERKGTGDLSEIIITNKENEQRNVYNLNIILKNTYKRCDCRF